MSAVLLEQASLALREHAQTAQHKRPWCPVYTRAAIRHVERNVELDVECADHPDGYGCDRFDMYDGEYVAMMHPPVALALADVLHDIAVFTEEHPDLPGPQEPVLKLARAILRQSAPLELVARGTCECCGEPTDTPPECRDCANRADGEAAKAWREGRE